MIDEVTECINETQRQVHKCYTIHPRSYDCQECGQDCTKQLTECPMEGVND